MDSVKNKFFTREFVPAAQISQAERMAWFLYEKTEDFPNKSER